jgi:hypothetical protein
VISKSFRYEFMQRLLSASFAFIFMSLFNKTFYQGNLHFLMFILNASWIYPHCQKHDLDTNAMNQSQKPNLLKRSNFDIWDLISVFDYRSTSLMIIILVLLGNGNRLTMSKSLKPPAQRMWELLTPQVLLRQRNRGLDKKLLQNKKSKFGVKFQEKNLQI